MSGVRHPKTGRYAQWTCLLPIKLNDAYTCQGRSCFDTYMAFDDLLYEGEAVGEFGEAIVVRKSDGLWVVAA